MNEQPINQNSPEIPSEKKPSFVVGFLVAIIIVLIVVGFFLLKTKNSEIQTPLPTVEKTTQVETTVPTATTQSEQAGSTANQSTQSGSTASTSQSTVDFNYELKQLDDQANSVSSTDFSDTEMSDTKAGL